MTPFFFSYTAAILATGFAVIAAVLLLRRETNNLTRQFTFFLFAGAVWIGANAAADVAYTETALVIASGFAVIGGVFLISFFLVFVDTFIDEQLPSTTRLILYLLPSTLFSIAAFSEYSVQETIFPAGQPAQIVPGIQYYFGLLWFGIALMYGLTRLIRAFHQCKGPKRMQTAYISIGFASMIVGQILFTIVLPLAGELRFFTVGPQFSVVLAGAMGYAIFKHNLLDIRIIIQRGLIYSVLLATIVFTYIVILHIFSSLLDDASPHAGKISAITATIVCLVTVPHLDKFLRRKTDILFFKDTYQYREAVRELSEILNRNLARSKIVTEISKALRRILKSSFVSIDLPQNGKTTPIHTDEVALSVPIIFKEQRPGSILLGPKRSGDPYNNTDTHLLDTLSYQLAMALERAELYEVVAEHSRELEKKIEARTHELKQAHEQQKQIITDISHGLQTPLTIIKSGLAEFKAAYKFSKDITVFEKSIGELSAFIYDLLHLVQIESKTVEEKMEQINLSTLVSEISEYIHITAAEKNVYVSCTVENDIFILGTRKKIEEALLNIIANGIKYIGHGKNKRISIALTTTKQTAKIEIADNGIGIKSEDVHKIFDRFYRSQANSGEKIEGSGLGLSITKAIIENHGGSIGVESSPKVGTTFTILLPRTGAST